MTDSLQRLLDFATHVRDALVPRASPAPPAGEALPVSERSSLRARRVRVEVRRSGEIVLVIPRRMSRAAAWRFYARHRDWAERKAREFAAHAPAPGAAPLRWDGTDVLAVAGVPRPLRVEPGAARFGGLTVADDALVLRTRRRDPASLARALKRGLAAHARAQAAAVLQEEGTRLGMHATGLRINDPVSQWGSCGPQGRISLSWRLVLAPPEVFRYVAVHELCHLRWRGHGPRFWGLVARQMPGYETQRRWLREHGAELHAMVPRR
ncbi:MAG TPA: YgjP-like metallopeptidase domain-containing protein [Candidatus Binatia bacterium]|nr:YgjP-like metallopeptidase domain-containing protein [Candidatus Binatia bacterium]